MEMIEWFDVQFNKKELFRTSKPRDFVIPTKEESQLYCVLGFFLKLKKAK